MANVYNFFKFLEDKAGKTIEPDQVFKLKLKYAKELLTNKEIAAASLADRLMYFPEKIDKQELAGDVDLSKTHITSLPDNLTVGGNLRLDFVPMTSLPKNLKVGGELNVKWSNIETLPPDLQVGDNLILSGTPLVTKGRRTNRNITLQQLKQMAPGVKGYIIM